MIRLSLGIVIGLMIAQTGMGADIMPTVTDLTTQSLRWIVELLVGGTL